MKWFALKPMSKKNCPIMWLAQKITRLHIHLLDMGNTKLARVQLKSHKDIPYIICNLDFEWASCDCPWAQMFFLQALNFVFMKLKRANFPLGL
jgi:hypothetical protein